VSTPRWVASLDAATLRELAALAERRSTVRRIADPAQAAQELAEMADRGTMPTIGWWHRHLAHDDDGGPGGT